MKISTKSGKWGTNVMSLTHPTTIINYMYRYIIAALLATALGLHAGAVSAASLSLEDIEFVALPGDQVQVKLVMSGPAPQPGSFTIDNPARIALDLPDTSLALSNKSIPVNIGLARSIRAIEAGGRTRVVFNLVRLIPYETRVEDNAIYLTIGAAQMQLTKSADKTMFFGKTSRNDAPIQDSDVVENIDFRRTEAGHGNIIIELSSAKTAVDIQQHGKQIIVDLLSTGIPDNLQRRLDVIDFATPVSTIDAYMQDDNARIVITANERAEHLAYQTGARFVVEVQPRTEEEAEEAKKDKFGYTGEKLSLNFQNIEVRAVLQLLADFTGLNMVTSDTVQGNITLRLKNVPWDQALDIILKAKGLDKRENGNVIVVAPSEEIAAREKQELEAKKQVEELAPLYNESIQFNYAKASEFSALLASENSSLLSERGSVTVDERTNTLLLRETASNITDIRRLVEELDIPIRQVMVESRIVIANDDFSKDLGVRFGATYVQSTSGGLNSTSGSALATDTITNSALSNLSTTGQPFPVTLPSIGDRMNVDLPVTNAAGTLALAILDSDYLIDLELSALQHEGKGEILSNPRVITSNQHEAMVESGVEIPYLQASSSGATNVAFKKAVLSLTVTPQITPDDRVILDLRVTKDSPGDVIVGVPSIDTKEINTQVLVNDGSTVVLGGVYEETRQNIVDKVPVLGDLPILGALFRSKSELENKAELLIFVTPKILKQSLQ